METLFRKNEQLILGKNGTLVLHHNKKLKLENSRASGWKIQNLKLKVEIYL